MTGSGFGNLEKVESHVTSSIRLYLYPNECRHDPLAKSPEPLGKF